MSLRRVYYGSSGLRLPFPLQESSVPKVFGSSSEAKAFNPATSTVTFRHPSPHHRDRRQAERSDQGCWSHRGAVLANTLFAKALSSIDIGSLICNVGAGGGAPAGAPAAGAAAAAGDAPAKEEEKKEEKKEESEESDDDMGFGLFD
ncbi:hypothetical protein OJAV_G00115520 [Oryzias javanicus]|uniref:Uncharacterized protein n=1 Tax=Oryzias javanicus TaxID=123683 RepID=A0A437CX40_ORYJA|nr:hypothetical protein OJAV_G00115520 [Oryzias javanicus]